METGVLMKETYTQDEYPALDAEAEDVRYEFDAPRSTPWRGPVWSTTKLPSM